MKAIILSIYLLPIIAYSQYKDDISIVQFSAKFTQEAELDLTTFKKYNTFTFYISEKQKLFDKENVKYLPTIILFENGEEIHRIESGINLKLPENSRETILEKIDKLLKNKF